ncbi:rod-binding protein [Sphingomonas sp. LY54]|uniref:rod-binding protein n=1 Tax=Sphingomonas sp. LY54 TaxID=3095343 RepID=UPI002D794E17|nr:rod-binding protein [Sphingomonas sp. LY54]WRP30266.1 rod-binding protein [Sphingomonas sp. LY54]
MQGIASTAQPAGQADEKRQQLVKAAQAFEAVFMRQMIGSMRQAKLSEDALGSSATEQFQEMQDAKLADQMAAKGGGFGIAELLLRQFDKRGEVTK